LEAERNAIYAVAGFFDQVMDAEEEGQDRKTMCFDKKNFYPRYFNKEKMVRAAQ
jgi:hypothetical protein